MGRRILVVEDEADSREALAMLVETAGYDPVPASNGREALQLARAHPPDVILLDLTMPVMDGFAFRAEQLQDAGLAHIPVLFTSAVADPDVCARLGAECLTKPLDLSALLDRLEQLCAPAPVPAVVPHRAGHLRTDR